jgi:recombination protein RecR
MTGRPENPLRSTPLTELIQQLKRLPGIGEKGAQRLAFFLIKSPPELSESLSQAIQAARLNTTLCPLCYNLSSLNGTCSICQDPKRDPHLLCVVETPVDLQAIEKSESFRGRYHILHGVISPLDGIGPEGLKIPELFARIE